MLKGGSGSERDERCMSERGGKGGRDVTSLACPLKKCAVKGLESSPYWDILPKITEISTEKTLTSLAFKMYEYTAPGLLYVG